MICLPCVSCSLAQQRSAKKFKLAWLKNLDALYSKVIRNLVYLVLSIYNVLIYTLLYTLHDTVGYGMTESTLRTHSNFIGYSRDGSIGVVMPFCESIVTSSNFFSYRFVILRNLLRFHFQVTDVETNKPLGPNQEGEICVRGPLIMKGYIGDEAATKHTIDSEGWLHTGDIGYYDEDGFFFITDRLKELIKYKGLQISPTELEQILLTHPDVIEAAVAPIPDEVAGELPRAYVVKRQGSSITEDDIAKFVAGMCSLYYRLYIS